MGASFFDDAHGLKSVDRSARTTSPTSPLTRTRLTWPRTPGDPEAQMPTSSMPSFEDRRGNANQHALQVSTSSPDPSRRHDRPATLQLGRAHGPRGYVVYVMQLPSSPVTLDFAPWEKQAGRPSWAIAQVAAGAVFFYPASADHTRHPARPPGDAIAPLGTTPPPHLAGSPH